MSAVTVPDDADDVVHPLWLEPGRAALLFSGGHGMQFNHGDALQLNTPVCQSGRSGGCGCRGMMRAILWCLGIRRCGCG